MNWTEWAWTYKRYLRLNGGKFPASTATVPSINIPRGTAPTSPQDGDLWFDGTNLKFRDGATTRTITWV